MLIDWFTVIAQAINFLILVWLLKRFLYKPILDAIDQREKGIATQLAEVEAKKTEAQKERDDFQHKNEAFDQTRAVLFQKATDEANAIRRRLLDEARQDADSLRAKRQDAFRTEERNLSQEINRWAQKEVFVVARNALKDLAGMSIEERMVEVFVLHLRSLTGAAKEQFATALKSSTQPARVRSAFDLPSDQRNAIQSAVKETFTVETQLQFETAAELVSGIELASNGQKVAWSIADYLATLQQSASELLHQEANPEPKPEAKPRIEPKVIAEPATNGEAKRVLELAASGLKAAP